jgi:hypothetical protein
MLWRILARSIMPDRRRNRLPPPVRSALIPSPGAIAFNDTIPNNCHSEVALRC